MDIMKIFALIIMNYRLRLKDGIFINEAKGIGGQILHEGVRVATEQLKAKKIYLEAQEYAIGYYAKEGFEVVSEPFMEDGIPHVKMEKVCD